MTDEQQHFVSYEGTHKARAVEAAFGVANGKEQVGILFEILNGELQGKSITGYFFFTDAAVDRTLESMRYCGWTGDSITDLTGLGDTEVEIVVVAEEWKGKWSNKVRWVNRPSRLMMNNQLEGPALAAFAARMRGKAVASKQRAGVVPVAAKPLQQSAAAPHKGGFADMPYDGPEGPDNYEDVDF